MEKDELIVFIVTEIALAVLISLVLKEKAIIFAFAFLLILLSGFPLYFKLEKLDLIEKLTVINFFGLSIVPCIYYLYGIIIQPLNKTVFILVPIVVFVLSYLAQKRL